MSGSLSQFVVFGRSVVATIGDEWRRHRKITARAFTHKSMQLVQAETAKQTSQMMANWEKDMKGDRCAIETYESLRIVFG
jgi:cytochrome P450